MTVLDQAKAANDALTAAASELSASIAKVQSLISQAHTPSPTGRAPSSSAPSTNVPVDNSTGVAGAAAFSPVAAAPISNSSPGQKTTYINTGDVARDMKLATTAAQKVHR